MPQIQRWYKGFSYTGKPQQLVDEVYRLVQQHHLSNFVPLLRVQKGAKKGRFYFFIAIESSQIGSVPPEVESVLLKLSFFQYPIKDSPGFIYEQIKSMVGATHDVYEYTNNIPYQTVQEFAYDNPFDLRESASINNVAIDINIISRQYDQLLYWLSALGSGTWESFKKGCEVLQLQEPKRILRRFRLLGYIESSLDGKRWSVAPGAIVKIHSQNSPEFILCGQRCTSWLTQLEKYAEIISLNQATANAPPCIRLKVNECKIITEHFSIIDAGNVSSLLADILPDITGWQQTLKSIPGIVPSLYDWKQFDGNDFVERTFQHETGMYQMWDREGGDFPRLTLFYEAETDTWHHGDWYGLRFLALHYSDHSLITRYDPTTARLAIPFSQRWPELYERALVLASGLLPTYHKTEQYLWLIYENITANLVEKLTKKLYVTCEEGFSRA